MTKFHCGADDSALVLLNGIQGTRRCSTTDKPFRSISQEKTYLQNTLSPAQLIFHCLEISNEDLILFIFKKIKIIWVLRLQHENDVAKFNNFVVMQEVELGKQNSSKLLSIERIYCLFRTQIHSCLDMKQIYQALLTLLESSNLFKNIKYNPLGFYITGRQAVSSISNKTLEFPVGEKFQLIQL